MPAPGHDARPAEVAGLAGVGGDERMPVGGIDRVRGARDEQQHDSNFDADDQVVEVGRLLDANDQQGRNDENDDDGGQIKDRGDV